MAGSVWLVKLIRQRRCPSAACTSVAEAPILGKNYRSAEARRHSKAPSLS
jgi:hypothetical protein